jgi:hypothetical protein
VLPKVAVTDFHKNHSRKEHCVKFPTWSKLAAGMAVAAAILAAIANTTTVITNVKSVLGWLPPRPTDSSKGSLQNPVKLTTTGAIAPLPVSATSVSATQKTPLAASMNVPGTADHRPKIIRRKLVPGLPAEFTPDLSIVVTHLYGTESSPDPRYTVGLKSAAWGNEDLDFNSGGEPFEVTVNHIRYDILIRDVRHDAQDNTFVDVSVTQYP